MGFIDAGRPAKPDRSIGYFEPYATSHDTLDGDIFAQEEIPNAARAVAKTVAGLRRGHSLAAQSEVTDPRPK
jgi:hypothetical protein